MAGCGKGVFASKYRAKEAGWGPVPYQLSQNVGNEEDNQHYAQAQQAKEDRDPEQQDLAFVLAFGRGDPDDVVKSAHRFKQRFQGSHGARETSIAPPSALYTATPVNWPVAGSLRSVSCLGRISSTMNAEKIA